MTTQEHLTLLFNEVAYNAIGVYPQEYHHADGTVHKRTLYQEGWNAALMKIIKNIITLEEWVTKNLDEPQMTDLVYCLEQDFLLHTNISQDPDKVSLYLNVNDTFVHAADAEDITIDDLANIVDIHTDFGYSGIVAWVAHKRGETPLDKYITLEFNEATENIKIYV